MIRWPADRNPNNLILKDFSIVLASGSRYRQALLERLGVPFSTWSPDVDESPRPGEAPAETAVRLARDKAVAAAARFPEAVVIGSDQVADLEGVPMGKPGTRERAAEQLRRQAGHTVVFHTAVCVIEGGSGRTLERVVPTAVRFRALTEAEITRYLDREAALDCAGAAKAEALGIALLEASSSEDPTALIGLPLIAVAALLREAGVAVP